MSLALPVPLIGVNLLLQTKTMCSGYMWAGLLMSRQSTGKQYQQQCLKAAQNNQNGHLIKMNDLSWKSWPSKDEKH